MSLLLSSFYDIAIKKEGQTYNRDGSNGANAFPAFFNSIQSVNMVVRTGEISTIEIKITPSYNDAIKILTSGLLGIGLGSKNQLPDKQGKTTGSASTTTADKILKDTMSGFAQVYLKLIRPGESKFETKLQKGCLAQPDVNISGNEITITLKGYANSVFMAGPKYTFTLEKRTIAQVVDTCCKLIGYTWKIKDGHSSASSLMEKVLDDQTKTDTPWNIMKWALGLQRLSFIESSSEESEDEITIYDTNISHFSKQTPKYTFVKWRQVSPADGIFPLLDFTMESAKSLFLSGRSFGVNKLGMNELIKKAVTSDNDPVNNSDQKAKEILNSATATSIRESQSNKVVVGDIPISLQGSVTHAPTQASQEQSQMGTNDAVTGSAVYQKFSLVVPGLPDISPLDQVQMLIGDIKELSGVLIVTSVTHNLDSGGWITNLETVMTGDVTQESSESKRPEMSKPSVSSDNQRTPRNVS